MVVFGYYSKHKSETNFCDSLSKESVVNTKDSNSLLKQNKEADTVKVDSVPQDTSKMSEINSQNMLQVGTILHGTYKIESSKLK